MDQPRSFRRKKTFELRLTPYELIHLRDLFSVMLPSELKQTVSQALASLEERSLVEARLWQKVVAACTEAELPTGDDAPDFVASAAAPPPIGIFRLAEEPAAEGSPAGSSPFDSEEE